MKFKKNTRPNAFMVSLIHLIIVVIFCTVVNAKLEEEVEWPSRIKVASIEKSARKYIRSNALFKTPVFMADVNDVNDLVDPNLVKVAVTIKCEKRWETFAVGKAIQCCDDNGKLVCYHVPVAIDAKDFPKLLTPVSPNDITPTTIRDPNLWGADEFWTFVVSAKETDYPIPLYYPGLPPYLVTFYKATEKAKQALGTETATFRRYYSLGHRGDFYEFESVEGNSVLIDCHTLRILDRKKVLVRAVDVAAEKPVLTPEEKERHQTMLRTYREHAKNAWDKVKKRFENDDEKKPNLERKS